MNLTIHRGTQEIGGSCVELESEGKRIIMDMGNNKHWDNLFILNPYSKLYRTHFVQHYLLK